MKNHFDALPGSDDEENTGFTTVKKDKQVQKPAVKKQKEEGVKERQVNQLNSHLNLRQKEDLKVIRNPRQPRPNKEITDHHAHDRRSGTGRVSEPRKGAGGAGGIGNIKDELNKDKILNRVQQDHQQEAEAEKQPEPQVLTLEEYYAKQGVDISKLDKKAEASKREPVNAQWIAKQKLTVMKTKADTNIQDDSRKVQTHKNQSHRITSNDEQSLLGFTSNTNAAKKQNNQNQGEKGKANEKTQSKPVINLDDFPSL